MKFKIGLILAILTFPLFANLPIDQKTGMQYEEDEIEKTRFYYSSLEPRRGERGNPIWRFHIYEKEGTPKKTFLVFKFERTKGWQDSIFPTQIAFFGDGQVEKFEIPFGALNGGFDENERASIGLNKTEAQILLKLIMGKRVYFRLSGSSKHENSTEFSEDDKEYLKNIITIYLTKF